MKTILIIVAGMADLPDPRSLKDTPLLSGHIPSLDLLAQRGLLTAFSPVENGTPLDHKNALLSIIGFDLKRSNPDIKELMSFGLDNNASISDYSTLQPYVLPVFSGHGVCVTPSAWVRGAAKCGFIRPLDIYSPGSSEIDILDVMSSLVTREIEKEEFVLVYIDTPLKASLRGDYDEKVRAIELIDRHLIAPIADYVWKSELLIQMAVTTDVVTPWHRQRPSDVSVPAVIYFNNQDWEGDPNQGFNEVQAMLMHRTFHHPSDLILYLSNFYAPQDSENNNPF